METTAKVDPIEVKLEDLALAVALLNAHGQKGFHQLALSF